MPLYESIYIIRQEVSSNDVDKLTDNFINLIKENGGELVKQEYWGLRNLAYEIRNNRKGHYIMLGIKAPHAAILEFERKMRLSEDVIRFLTVAAEAISSDVSPILKSREENIAAVDVTVLSSQE
jgi:small subunit ribosomal protein S6